MNEKVARKIMFSINFTLLLNNTHGQQTHFTCVMKVIQLDITTAFVVLL